MSRRGNGLSADAYAPLVDLAPELADTLLVALGEAGIAAYAAQGEPPAEEVGSATVDTADASTLLERLYVDDTRTSAAEEILHVHLTQLREQRRGGHASGPAESGVSEGGTTGAATTERDEEAIWAEIVAGFDAELEEGTSPWPEEENLAPGEDQDGELPTARVIKPAGADVEPPEDFDDEDDEDDHYIPPPPPPLPSGDPVTVGAWVALVAGPLYLLLSVVVGWEVQGWQAFTAVAAFIGGFVTLVLRMGDEPRDPDDGAVI